MTNAADQPLWGLRAVVTGGAGFVGSWLVERMLHLGAHVVCVDDLSTGCADNLAHLAHEPALTVVHADVCDGLAVPGTVDWVLHLASPASPADYLRMPIATMRVGSTGTMNALQLAAAKRARFLLASTSEVYGDPLEHPQRETYWGNVNPVGPRAVYDEAKRFAEALTTAYRVSEGVDTGIVRLFNTFGPRMRLDDGRAVPTFVRQALAGEPLTVAGDGSQTRSLCYVEDVVAGILAMARSTCPGPVNIGGSEETTLLELAHRVLMLSGSRAPVVFVDLPQDDPRVRRPDTTRARELLGWEPRVSVYEGLVRTLRWARGLARPAPRALRRPQTA